MGQSRGTERVWIVEMNPETGEVDPEEVAQVAVDVATVVRMCGGTHSSTAERVQDDRGIFRTIAIYHVWHSWAPQVQREEPPPPPVEENGARLQVAAEPQEPPPGEADPEVYAAEEDLGDDVELLPLTEEVKADLRREGLPVQ